MFSPLMNVLDNAPAFVFGTHLEILTSNMVARAVIVDVSMYPASECNIVWQMFINPMFRQLFVDWEEVARSLIARLRRNWGRYPEDPGIAALVQRLIERSPDFYHWWATHEVSTRANAEILLDHPLAGRLSFRQYTLQPAARPGLTLMLLAPLPATNTAESVRSLLGGTMESG